MAHSFYHLEIGQWATGYPEVSVVSFASQKFGAIWMAVFLSNPYKELGIPNLKVPKFGLRKFGPKTNVSRWNTTTTPRGKRFAVEREMMGSGALKQNSQCLRSLPCWESVFRWICWSLLASTPFYAVFCWCSRIRHSVERAFSTFSWHFVESKGQNTSVIWWFSMFDSFDSFFTTYVSVLIFVVSQLSFHHVQRLEAVCGTLTDCEKSLPLGRLVKQDPFGELTERSRLDWVRPF